MPREKSPPPPSGGIPAWFMTYSDVITLLMTFFILLLTFATNQPETFEQMKTSMFGGLGSMGIADEQLEAIERESLALRSRPRMSRLTQRGTETPPLSTDAASESIDKGLKSLDQSNDLAQFKRMTFETPLNAFVDDQGKLTDAALVHLRMLTNQLRKMSVEVRFEVGRMEDLPAIIEMCDLLTNGLKIPTGRVGAAVVEGPGAPRHGLRIAVTRTMP